MLVDNFFLTIAGASPTGGIGGIAPPIFIFAPPIYFLPPLYFLEVSIALTVKIVVILTVPSPILTSILFD